MGRRYISADIAAYCGVHSVNAADDARNDVIAILKAQAYAVGLVGQADQPVIQLDAFRRHGRGQLMLKSRAVECQAWCAHLLPVPLSYKMRP